MISYEVHSRLINELIHLMIYVYIVVLFDSVAQLFITYLVAIYINLVLDIIYHHGWYTRMPISFMSSSQKPTKNKVEMTFCKAQA